MQRSRPLPRASVLAFLRLPGRSDGLARTRPYRLTPLLVAATALTACEQPPTSVSEAPALEVAANGSGGPGRALRLMTRNVYLGGDVAPVLAVDFSDIAAVTAAAATVWASVQANDFAARAAEIASEIARNRPEVVGLQEVARFITLDAAFQPTGVLDYVSLLQSALSARGLEYDLWVQENTDVVLPIEIDPQAGAVTGLLRFTDRIALLVDRDLDDVVVTQGNYATTITLAPGVTLKRGWIRLRAADRDRPFELVNTHLEGQALAPVQAGQTAELLALLAGASGPTYVLGDLNSDAAADPGAPSWTPTYDVLRDAGFADVWLESQGRRPRGGFTCCHLPDLSNPPGLLDERIDFILVRGAPTNPHGALLGAIRADIVGEERRDRTPGGLWPSDHAGLVAALRFPPGLVVHQ